MLSKQTNRYRIRRCEGNHGCWMLVHLRGDGSEIDSFGGYTTSYSIDSLLKHAGHLQPRSGDQVELVP
jgi:hypothetical protein